MNLLVIGREEGLSSLSDNGSEGGLYGEPATSCISFNTSVPWKPNPRIPACASAVLWTLDSTVAYNLSFCCTKTCNEGSSLRNSSFRKRQRRLTSRRLLNGPKSRASSELGFALSGKFGGV